jgi:hypothetical protein
MSRKTESTASPRKRMRKAGTRNLVSFSGRCIPVKDSLREKKGPAASPLALGSARRTDRLC